MHPRRDGHERLHARVLEDRKEHDKPERRGEVLDRLPVEPATRVVAHVPAAVRLIHHVVPCAEVAVEEEYGDGADEREQGDGGRDPQRPGVRAEVHGDDVRG